MTGDLEARVMFGSFYTLVKFSLLVISVITIILGMLHVSPYWIALMAVIHVIGYWFSRNPFLGRSLAASGAGWKSLFLLFFGLYLAGLSTQGVIFLVGYGISTIFI